MPQKSVSAADPTTAGADVEQGRFEARDELSETSARLEKNGKKPEIEVSEKPSEGPAAAEVSFFVEKIVVTGNTAVSSEDIRKLVGPYENRTLKLSEAVQAAAAITDFYHNRGFITCRAYIPPQKIENKILEIRIFEGRLGQLQVRGNRFSKTGNITRFLEKLKGKVMEYRALEKNLFKANLHPDREVRAVVIPGKEVGTSDLLLDVKDRFPLHVGAEINNFGTKLTGLERYNVSLRHTNVLGMDDIFAARFQWGKEVFGFGSQYVLPVGAYETQVGVSFNYTEVEVGREFEERDIEGTAYAAKIFFNQPFLDTDFVDFTWTGGFEYKTVDNSERGLPTSRDDLRLFRTGINIDEADPFGRMFVVNELTFGVTYFGASDKNDPRLSRPDAGASFFKYNLAINRIHPVYNGTYLYLKGTLQMTSDKLLSAEQYDIGGVYSVRGYPQSEYLGDKGAGWSVELRVPCYFLGPEVKVPGTSDPLWNKIHFIGFVDSAWAKLNDRDPDERDSRTFLGAGGGLRIDLPRHFSARFEWAAPLGNRPADKDKSQFYFSISGEI
jgi:hemolysin activation/secretion protein